MPIDLLAIGDISIDQYMKVEKAVVNGSPDDEEAQICFGFGSKIPISEYNATIAGNACNNVVASTKLGLKCAIYTECGDDPNAKKFAEVFEKIGVDYSSWTQDAKIPTNVHTIIVHKGERTILSYHANRNYKLKNWGKPKWIYYTSLSPNFDEFQKELVSYLKENKDIGVAFNPGSFHMKAGVDRLRNMLQVTDVLFVNEDEAKSLAGNFSKEELHKALQKLGPKLTVVTDGKNGSSAHDGQKMTSLGILDEEIRVEDKTGAGDAHSAGFLAALHHGKSIEEALKWGTLNSAGVITKVGSVHGLLTKVQIEEKLSTNPKFK